MASPWQSLPLQVPTDGATVWVRLNYWFGEPFEAVWDEGNQWFRDTGPIGFRWPFWTISR